ncbi:MAG: transglycosylase domain-containing protein [bacterium]
MIKKTLKTLLVLTFIVFAIGSVGFMSVVAYVSRDLPDIQTIDDEISPTTTKIYDKSGEVLLYEYGNIRRIPVDISTIPESLKKAALAIEDHEFYSHQGFSLRGIVRSMQAAYQNKEIVASGSTITQQLIKNSLLSPEKTFMRKAKEIILSIQLEQHLSKDEILERYLNAIPYGGMSYGCQAASQLYFNKDVKDLSLAESAFLAGLTAAPSYFAPSAQNYESTTDDVLKLIEPLNMVKEEDGVKVIPAWKKRQSKALLDMAAYGYITQEEAEKAIVQPLIFEQQKIEKIAPHFVDYVQERLVTWFAQKFDNDEQRAEQYIKNNGFTVISSLEMDKQQLAESVLAKHRRQLNNHHTNNAAMVAIRPDTGTIAAMVGSFDYYDVSISGQVNVTTSPYRQVGSSIKPLIYVYGLERGETTVTLLNDSPIKYPQNYVPHNFDYSFHGKLYMRTALANSYNLPALDMIDKMGVPETVDFLHRAGLTTIDDLSKVGLSVALGATEIKLLDETYGFSMLANRGAQAGDTAIVPKNNKIEHYRELDPVAILKITDNQDKVVYEFEPKTKQIVREGNAYIITDILSDYQARTPMFGSWSALNVSGYRVAGKTGTASDLKDITTVGFYPKMTVGVWCGNSDRSSMWNVEGVTEAAPIWNDFISEVIKRDGYSWYEKPEDVVEKWVFGRKELFLIDNIPQRISPEQRVRTTPTTTTTPNVLTPYIFTPIIPGLTPVSAATSTPIPPKPVKNTPTP